MYVHGGYGLLASGAKGEAGANLGEGRGAWVVDPVGGCGGEAETVERGGVDKEVGRWVGYDGAEVTI